MTTEVCIHLFDMATAAPGQLDRFDNGQVAEASCQKCGETAFVAVRLVEQPEYVRSNPVVAAAWAAFAEATGPEPGPVAEQIARAAETETYPLITTRAVPVNNSSAFHDASDRSDIISPLIEGRGVVEFTPAWTHEVTGGPWPERIGRRCRVVTDELDPYCYPVVTKRSVDAVIAIENDPLRAQVEGAGRQAWSCVIDVHHLRPLTQVTA